VIAAVAEKYLLGLRADALSLAIPRGYRDALAFLAEIKPDLHIVNYGASDTLKYL
jgi:hypothetical protein